MASAFVPGASGPGSSPGRPCCVLGQDTTLTVPLSTQEYEWVPNCWGKFKHAHGGDCGEVTCDGLASRQGE